MKCLFVITLSISLITSSWAQDSLEVFHCSESLKVILSEFVIEEQSKSYFSKELKFGVHFHFLPDDTLVQVSSLGVLVAKQKRHLGCVVFDGFLFIIAGEKTIEELFCTSSKYCKDVYNSPLILRDENELFTTKYYLFKKGQFFLTDLGTP